MKTIRLVIPNPFRVGVDGSAEICHRKYERLCWYLRQNPSAALRLLPKLHRDHAKRMRGRADPKVA